MKLSNVIVMVTDPVPASFRKLFEQKNGRVLSRKMKQNFFIYKRK